MVFVSVSDEEVNAPSFTHARTTCAFHIFNLKSDGDTRRQSSKLTSFVLNDTRELSFRIQIFLNVVHSSIEKLLSKITKEINTPQI